MEPVRTRGSNFVYKGPTSDVGDAWVERHPSIHAVYLTWKLTDEERQAIADGANLRLGIHNIEPIPPVSLGIDELEEITPEAAILRDRAYTELRRVAVGPDQIPPGFWMVSPATWRALNETQALDLVPDDSVPTLLGKPIMQAEAIVGELLEYATMGAPA